MEEQNGRKGHRLGILGTEVLLARHKSTSSNTWRSNSFDSPHGITGMVSSRQSAGSRRPWWAGWTGLLPHGQGAKLSASFPLSSFSFCNNSVFLLSLGIILLWLCHWFNCLFPQTDRMCGVSLHKVVSWSHCHSIAGWHQHVVFLHL